MNNENKTLVKVKEYIRLNKPFFIFICSIFIFILYANDRFRATFTSIAQICTGIGAIIALYSNIRQIDRQNILDEERIKIKRRRKIFISIIDEFFSIHDDKKHSHSITQSTIVNKHNINNDIFKKLQLLYNDISKQKQKTFDLSNNIYHGQYDDELEQCFM